jgi:hypothetical protein
MLSTCHSNVAVCEVSSAEAYTVYRPHHACHGVMVVRRAHLLHYLGDVHGAMELWNENPLLYCLPTLYAVHPLTY